MEPEQAPAQETGPTLQDQIKLLIPDGIENFRPSCIVCTTKVPAKRAKGRSRDTCSPPCQAVLRLYRKHLLRSTKCISCYHPSTPEERAEFMQWRKHRGDKRDKRGRPPKVKPEANPTGDVIESGSGPIDISRAPKLPDGYMASAGTTFEQLDGMKLLTELDAMKTLMGHWSQARVTFEEARIILVQQKHWTMGYAGEYIENAEKLTGITLAGREPKTSPVVELCAFGGYCNQPAFHTGDHDADPKETAKNTEVAEHFNTRKVGARTRRAKVNV